MCFDAFDPAADLDLLDHPILNFIYYLVCLHIFFFPYFENVLLIEIDACSPTKPCMWVPLIRAKIVRVLGSASKVSNMFEKFNPDS